MCHRVLLGSVLDPIGHQSPPPPLLAQCPARQLTFDGRVHLQAFRVVFAIAMGFPRKQRDEVDQHGAMWMDAAENGAQRLSSVPDLLHRHCSIICSKVRDASGLAAGCSPRKCRVSWCALCRNDEGPVETGPHVRESWCAILGLNQ